MNNFLRERNKVIWTKIKVLYYNKDRNNTENMLSLNEKFYIHIFEKEKRK